uniref:Uncharacterized protein n=1 Tax=Bos indicus x Bos taurus TaxID=30522 RepID=A0A4W2DRR9_BOBOX
MYPQVCTRTALGQTERQGILLQETQVIFHVPRQGAQLLPERVQLLHHGFVEGLAVGPHGAAEVLHLLVQAALLGMLLHLKGQALQLVVELPLDVLSIRGQAAAQFLHVLLDLGLELVRVGRQAPLELFHALVDRGLELLGVGRQRGLQLVQVLPHHLLHALRIGRQLAPQLLRLGVDLGAQLLCVWSQALL